MLAYLTNINEMLDKTLYHIVNTTKARVFSRKNNIQGHILIQPRGIIMPLNIVQNCL